VKEPETDGCATEKRRTRWHSRRNCYRSVTSAGREPQIQPSNPKKPNMRKRWGAPPKKHEQQQTRQQGNSTKSKMAHNTQTHAHSRTFHERIGKGVRRPPEPRRRQSGGRGGGCSNGAVVRMLDRGGRHQCVPGLLEDAVILLVVPARDHDPAQEALLVAPVALHELPARVPEPLPRGQVLPPHKGRALPDDLLVKVPRPGPHLGTGHSVVFSLL
jgi:hypothetical protein